MSKGSRRSWTLVPILMLIAGAAEAASPAPSATIAAAIASLFNGLEFMMFSVLFRSSRQFPTGPSGASPVDPRTLRVARADSTLVSRAHSPHLSLS